MCIPWYLHLCRLREYAPRRVLLCDSGTAQDSGRACSMPFAARVKEYQGIHVRHRSIDSRPASSFERVSLTLQIQQIKQHNHMFQQWYQNAFTQHP